MNPTCIKVLGCVESNPNLLDNKGFGPIHYAALTLENNIEVLSHFLNFIQKIDINLRDKNGRTPLHLAAENGNIHVMRPLQLKCLIILGI